MYPILFHNGNLTIYSWGVMLAVGVMISAYLLYRKFSEENIHPNHLMNIVLLSVFFGILGARLLYVFLYEWDYYSLHLLGIFWQHGGLSGLVWYGGFIGGLLFTGFTGRDLLDRLVFLPGRIHRQAVRF